MQDIPVLAHTHTWGTVTYTWSADGKNCEAKRVCTKDATHIETATAEITSAVKTPATESAKGTTTYTATFVESWATTQTKDVQDIPTLAHTHTWGAATYTWSADGKSCVAKRVCTKDAAHVETATATITSAVKTPATETVKGTTTYTATFAENWAATQTKDVQDIPALTHTHTWGSWMPDGASGHKRVCADDASHVDKAPHTYGGDNRCDVCGYVKNTVKPDPQPPVADCACAKFTDVNRSLWYHEGIDYVIENGLMNGVSDDRFAPMSTTNRAMIVTILWRLEGEPAGPDAGFADVADGQWYSEAIDWAAANGIVTGYSAEKFGPMNSITREQMAAILYRYADYKGYDVASGEDTNILSYVDAENVSEYAIASMQWAVGEGLINGVEGNALAPQGTATRAQVATILMRFCENIVK